MVLGRDILGDMPPRASKYSCLNLWFKSHASLLFANLLIVLASISAFPQVSNKTLAHVNRVYIESYPTSDRSTQIQAIRTALIARGFEVIEERSQPDAVLSWEQQTEIVLHGDGSIPDKSIFTWQLLLADNKPIWKHRIKFVSKKSLNDDLAYAAQKFAKKLSEDKAQR